MPDGAAGTQEHLDVIVRERHDVDQPHRGHDGRERGSPPRLTHASADRRPLKTFSARSLPVPATCEHHARLAR